MTRNLNLLLFVLISTVFNFANRVYAQTSGTFMVVKGDVTVTSKDGKSDKAKVGKKIIQSDTIITGPDSRAKVIMADQNTFNISPDTKLLLEKYIYDQSKGDKQVIIAVMEGKVRATVEQKYDGEKNQFQVKTPAAVAGVRGTDFLTSYSGKTKETKIVTFEGKVAVGLPGPGGTIQNPVFVTPGQMSTTKVGQAPMPPISVPKEELKSMNSGSKADATNKDVPGSKPGPDQGAKDGNGKEVAKEKSDPNASKDGAKDSGSGNQGNGSPQSNDKKGDAKSQDTGSTTSAGSPNSNSNGSAPSPAIDSSGSPSTSTNASGGPSPQPPSPNNPADTRQPANASTSGSMPAGSPPPPPMTGTTLSGGAPSLPVAPMPSMGGCSMCTALDTNTIMPMNNLPLPPTVALPPQIKNLPITTVIPPALQNTIINTIQTSNNGPVNYLININKK